MAPLPPTGNFATIFSKAAACSPLENKCPNAAAGRPNGLVSSKEFAVEGLKNLISLEKNQKFGAKKKICA
jgi:hypothetical protein